MSSSDSPGEPGGDPNGKPNDIAGLLATAALRWPDRVGFSHGDVRWTYGEAAARAADVAASLRAHGVSPGDVVAWIGDNTPAAALAYFGAAWAGAVLAPLHLRLTDADLRRVVTHAEARCVLAESSTPSRERAAVLGLPILPLNDKPVRSQATAPFAPARRRPSDPAHLYYTSGSTGTPKGVILTHGNVVSHARLAAAALSLSDRDVWLHAAPMFHLADAWATFSITLVGGEHRFVPRFSEAAVLNEFERGVTATNLVPTMWNALVRDPSLSASSARRYPSLRLLLSGGSAIAPALVRRIRSSFCASGAEYAQTYGLTETSPYLTISRLVGDERALPEDDACALLSRAGTPMPGVTVRVVGADGHVVPSDGISAGEVLARGPTVTPGYWKNPQADAAAFRDGWFLTGDLARVHPDGRIDLADRTGDVVNSGGEKVFSTDVERALADAPGVRELVVVGSPDAHWGEIVTAVVVAEGPAPTLDSLQAHARGHLADFKLPRRLVLVDALPRTASGKLSKHAARALCSRQHVPR